MKEGKEVNVLGIEMLNRRLLFANVENRCRIKAMCSLWTSTVRLFIAKPRRQSSPRAGHCLCSKYKIPCIKQAVDYGMECLNNQGVGSTSAKFYYRYGLKG